MWHVSERTNSAAKGRFTEALRPKTKAGRTAVRARRFASTSSGGKWSSLLEAGKTRVRTLDWDPCPRCLVGGA